MKTLAIAIIASLGMASAFAQPAKTPVAAAPAAAPAKAEAPKEEMKLAKKKEDKKADATKSAPVKTEATPATVAPKADAKPASK
jgi:hypothetical protein